MPVFTSAIRESGGAPGVHFALADRMAKHAHADKSAGVAQCENGGPEYALALGAMALQAVQFREHGLGERFLPAGRQKAQSLDMKIEQAGRIIHPPPRRARRPGDLRGRCQL